MSTIERETRETRIRVVIDRNPVTTAIDTSIPFLDHMLQTLARYGGIGLSVTASGDLPHHIVEDVAICMGAAVAAYAPASCARFGDCTIPMDDALVHCALDLGGRVFYAGPLPSNLYDHWMRSFAENAKTTLHLRVLRGRDRHHIVEAAFKALGLALRQALRAGESDAVFSTKGAAVVRAEP